MRQVAQLVERVYIRRRPSLIPEPMVMVIYHAKIEVARSSRALSPKPNRWHIVISCL